MAGFSYFLMDTMKEMYQYLRYLKDNKTQVNATLSF